MAFNDELQLSDLLTPIPGDSPVGPDLKYSNEFSEIEWAHTQGQDTVPPTRSPGYPGAEAEEHFGNVVDMGTEFLEEKSKDLRVAFFVTAGLLRIGSGDTSDFAGARCFAGLASGLELLRRLMEEFWDDLYPGVAARSFILGSLASDAFTIPVRLVPVTAWGHTHFHFKEWARDAVDEKGAPPEEDTLWAGNFEKGLADTSREAYEQLSEALGRCVEELDTLETFCREKFSETDEPPPRFSDLQQALKQLTAAADQLLEKKAPPPPPETEKEEAPAAPPGDPAPAEASSPGGAPSQEEPAQGAQESVQPQPPPSAQPQAQPASTPGAATGARAPVAPKPQNPQQAVSAIAGAAAVLRQEDPTDPVPYLLTRSFRWGELRREGPGIDPQLLEAPSSDDRKRLRTLFLEEKWEELLAASEEIMAAEAGRGWVDLQRYSLLASEKLGKNYRPVAEALRGALRGLLEDLPDLVSATLMDDSAPASSDTLSWLEAAGFLAPDRGDGEEGDDQDDTDPEKARREGSFRKARQLVQGGDPEGAIRLLMQRASAERSERARFVTKAEAAAIMVEQGDAAVARPILDELLKEVDEHNLEDWEAGGLVARPLGLLFRCLDAQEGQVRQQIYQRICRLDPLLARKVGDDSNG